MFQGGIPLCIWSDYVLTAIYLINRLPSSVLNGKSPYELVHKKKPDLSHLRCFGCLCFQTVFNNQDKFTYRSNKCVLIGYSSIKKAYKLFNLDNRSVIFSKDVRFYETIFPFKMKSKTVNDSDDDLIPKDADHLTFFDYKTSHTPNDEIKVLPVVDGSNSSFRTDTMYFEDESATHHGDFFEGNVPKSPISFSFNSDQPDVTDNGQPSARKSSRPSKLHVRFNDHVIESNVKYGVEKYVNYSRLNSVNYCFSTTLNKSVKPTTYQEAVKDIN